MERRLIWQLAMLLGLSSCLAGCAAIDLMDGQLPEEEEEDLESFFNLEPYPRPSDRRPRGGSAPATTSTPAPVVTPAETKPAPSAVVPASAQQPATDSAPATTSPPAAASPAPAANEASSPAAAPAAPQELAPIAVNSARPVVEAVSAPDAANEKEANKEAGDAAAEKKSAEDRRSEIVKRREELAAALRAAIELYKEDPAKRDEVALLENDLRLLDLIVQRPAESGALSDAERDASKRLVDQLAAPARLEVRNLRFCERVEGFGWYTEFPAASFRPRQQAILYAEVENFNVEQRGADTYETELSASYQVFDDRGTLVDERQLPLDKETCRNRRRDYFLAYRIYLPGAAPGRYRLELTIEDRKSYDRRKLGSGTIEYSVGP